jgi:SAM-dependent methyltransferase
MLGWSPRCQTPRYSSWMWVLGTGRDAAWFASRGLRVVAVEPSIAMLAEAQRRHQSSLIQWVEDHLPSLDRFFRAGLSFDPILLSAVWMHVAPADRQRAFRSSLHCSSRAGCIALTLRHGPVQQERSIHEVSQAEIEQLARAHGAFVERATVRHS